MTVESLIKELEKHPSQMRITVDGYEAGVSDVSDVKLIKLKLDTAQPHEWYYGKHSAIDNGDEYDEFALHLRSHSST